MSKKIDICAHCGREFNPNPRVKKQRYCGNKACQRARHAVWQRRKLVEDPDYRDNQRRCQRQWQEHSKRYYRLYRKNHPEYSRRNRFLQHIRNNRRRKGRPDEMIAKMDSLLKPYYSRKGSMFRLVPQGSGVIAKMDSLIVKLIPHKRLGAIDRHRLDCKIGLDSRQRQTALE